jgi:hypothetical protein
MVTPSCRLQLPCPLPATAGPPRSHCYNNHCRLRRNNCPLQLSLPLPPSLPLPTANALPLVKNRSRSRRQIHTQYNCRLPRYSSPATSPASHCCLTFLLRCNCHMASQGFQRSSALAQVWHPNCSSSCSVLVLSVGRRACPVQLP